MGQDLGGGVEVLLVAGRGRLDGISACRIFNGWIGIVGGWLVVVLAFEDIVGGVIVDGYDSVPTIIMSVITASIVVLYGVWSTTYI